MRQADQIGTAPFLDGVVVHDRRTGRLFQLNHTAAQVWRSLRNGDHEEAIVGALARTHGLNPAAVRGDFGAFLDALYAAGLLGPRRAMERGAAAAVRPSRGQPGLDAAYRLGEMVVRVTCYPADLAAAFAPLAAPALVPNGTPAQARLALFRAGDAFVLTRDGRPVDRLDTAPAARWAMVRQLVSAARRRPWLALLHAGAIALPAGCLLLCGDSGAGKSSLLAGLVHAGFRFVADDIVPLEGRSGLVWPVRLAISIKSGSWPVIGNLFPELAQAPIVHFGGRTMRYLWPDAHAVAVDAAGYPAAAVLFPRYVQDAPAALSRLDPAKSLALLGEGGSVLPATDAELAEFLVWWASCQRTNCDTAGSRTGSRRCAPSPTDLAQAATKQRQAPRRRSPPRLETLPVSAMRPFPRPLDLLCTCLAAAQQGRTLDPASAAALIDPMADLVGLARVAGRHCITPMLAACITDPELRQRLPNDFVLYLQILHGENSRRNRALRVQLRGVAQCLNEIGVEPLLLKGAIRLVDGLYRDPGWRFMRDLDLLVPRDRLSDAVARLALVGYGFTQDAASWPEGHKHLPPLGRDGDAAVVEIHSGLLSERQALCPAEEVLARSRLVDLDGVRVRVPHTADQLAQLIGHDRLDGYLRRSGMFLLRSVFEAALLCRDEGSVRQLRAQAAAAGLTRETRVWLGLAARLFPEYVRLPPDADLRDRLQTHALMAMERFDENGRWRRLVWFARLRMGKLLASRTERAHLASNILSLDYGHRSIQRLRRLWASH